MRKKIAISFLFAALIVTNVCTLLCLARSSLLATFWKNEATVNAEFAAKLWSWNNFSKGKIVKLRLKVEQEAKAPVSEPTEFDGPYVVREWIGYEYPFFGADSPSVQIARITVDTYNAQMKEMVENPEKFRQELAEEIEYWKTNVLNEKNVRTTRTKPTASRRVGGEWMPSFSLEPNYGL